MLMLMSMSMSKHIKEKGSSSYTGYASSNFCSDFRYCSCMDNNYYSKKVHDSTVMTNRRTLLLWVPSVPRLFSESSVLFLFELKIYSDYSDRLKLTF